MLPNAVNNDDFELARSAKRELMHLRSRGTTPAADDVMLIARKAGLAEFLQYPSKTKVDIVRADAWLAICTLADLIARNAGTVRGRPARQGRRHVASLTVPSPAPQAPLQAPSRS